MQDTFARARTRPKGYAKRARDDRVSCIRVVCTQDIIALVGCALFSKSLGHNHLLVEFDELNGPGIFEIRQ